MMRIKGDPTGEERDTEHGKQEKRNVKGNFCVVKRSENKLYHHRSDLRMVWINPILEQFQLPLKKAGAHQISFSILLYLFPTPGDHQPILFPCRHTDPLSTFNLPLRSNLHASSAHLKSIYFLSSDFLLFLAVLLQFSPNRACDKFFLSNLLLPEKFLQW